MTDSAATRFARVPLWLFDLGLPMQAIATYAWLHGRYGHYTKINPSYATLAKELGVSRGSVIAYMKALEDAGAIRVIEQGNSAARGSNSYEIAFDRPFGKPQVGPGQPTDQGGQPSDQGGQSADQVSMPTRSDLHFESDPGQYSDHPGQPAVPDIDIQTKQEPDPPPYPPQPTAAPDHRQDTEGKEEKAPAHDEHTDTAWILDRIDFARPIGTGERDRLATILSYRLHAGWPRKDLLAAVDGRWNGVDDRVAIVHYRASQQIGDPPPPRVAESRNYCPMHPTTLAADCGQCATERAAADDRLGLGTEAPDYRTARAALRERR